MTKQRIIVTVTNDLVTDQRVHKVCMFLHERGHDVLLVGRKRKMSPDIDVRPYLTRRMKLLFEKGALFYAAFNLRLFFFLLFSKYDLVVANDLDTLLACYRASKFRGKKLVYDSHEYFTEVPELIHRPRVQKFWEGIEKRIFPKLQIISTVNESIAGLYEKKYGKNCKTQYYSFYNMENIPLNQYTVRFVSFIKANKFTWDLKTPQAFSYFMEMTYSVDPVCKKSKKST